MISPPPFSVSVRRGAPPLLEISHFATAGCHFPIPQKSPIAFQAASGATETSTLFFTSTARAGLAKTNAVRPINAGDVLIIVVSRLEVSSGKAAPAIDRACFYFVDYAGTAFNRQRSSRRSNGIGLHPVSLLAWCAGSKHRARFGPALDSCGFQAVWDNGRKCSWLRRSARRPLRYLPRRSLRCASPRRRHRLPATASRIGPWCICRCSCWEPHLVICKSHSRLRAALGIGRDGPGRRPALGPPW